MLQPHLAFVGVLAVAGIIGHLTRVSGHPRAATPAGILAGALAGYLAFLA